MNRFIITLLLTLAVVSCAVEPTTREQATVLETDYPTYTRDCADTIERIIEDWRPQIAQEVCALPKEKLENITIGPIGPLDSSNAAKSAYRDFRRSCTELKGQRKLLQPEEVNQFIKDSVMSVLCTEIDD